MRITWVIGNGFDIHYGLKTKYVDFYLHLKDQDRAKTQPIRKLVYKFLAAKGEAEAKSGLTRICNFLADKCRVEIHPIYELIYKSLTVKDKPDSSINWADLEVALGQFTALCSHIEPEEMGGHIRDLVDDLHGYLKKQEQSDHIKDLKSRQAAFQETLTTSYLTGLSADDRNIFQGLIGTAADPVEFSFLSFNYTNLFQRFWDGLPPYWSFIIDPGSRCIARKADDTCQVHGNLTRGGILVGVDNEYQYNYKRYQGQDEYLRKPVMNQRLGFGYPGRAERIIEGSDIFLIYGCSLGATDKLWWGHMARQVLADKNRYIVVFHYVPGLGPGSSLYGKYQNELRNDISHILALPSSRQTELDKRLIITPFLDRLF